MLDKVNVSKATDSSSNKTIMWLIIVSIVVTIIWGLILNSPSSEEKLVLEALELEYGKEFEVSHSSYYYGGAAFFVYPSEDSTLVFQVEIKDDGEVNTFRYAQKLLEREVETIIKEEFAKNNFNVESQVSIGLNGYFDVPLNISPYEFMTECSHDNFTAGIVLEKTDSINASIITDIYLELYEKFPNVGFGTILYIVSEADFERISPSIIKSPGSFNLHDLEFYGAEDHVTEFNFGIFETGIPNKTVEEVSELLLN